MATTGADRGGGGGGGGVAEYPSEDGDGPAIRSTGKDGCRARGDVCWGGGAERLGVLISATEADFGTDVTVTAGVATAELAGGLGELATPAVGLVGASSGMVEDRSVAPRPTGLVVLGVAGVGAGSTLCATCAGGSGGDGCRALGDVCRAGAAEILADLISDTGAEFGTGVTTGAGAATAEPAGGLGELATAAAGFGGAISGMAANCFVGPRPAGLAVLGVARGGAGSTLCATWAGGSGAGDVTMGTDRALAAGRWCARTVATASDSGRTFAGCWSKYPPHPEARSAAPSTTSFFPIAGRFPSMNLPADNLSRFCKARTLRRVFRGPPGYANECFTKVAE